MARLTKAIKEKIVHNALVKAGVFERDAKNAEARAKLADACRIEALGGEAQIKKMVKLKDQMEKLRKEFLEIKGNASTSSGYSNFHTQARIRVAFGGMQVVLNYSGGTEVETSRDFQGKSVQLSPAPNSRYTALTLAHDHPLAQDWEAIEAEQKIINDIRENIETNTWAMINSFTTDTKLLKEWPEVAELLPKDIGVSANLPSVNVNSLNEMIGIPTSKEE